MASKKKNAPKKTDVKLGWHFLPANMKLDYGDNRKVSVGATLSIDATETPRCCHIGMHASEQPGQAAGFEKGQVLCRVEVWGDIDTNKNKFCGRHRKVLWMHALTLKDLNECLKSIGEYYSKTVGEALAKLNTAGKTNASEVNSWLVNWAKKNGCVDGKYNSPTAPFVKPDIDEKTVISLIPHRYVVTKNDIKNALGSAFDMSNFDSVIDDLSFHSDVIEVDNFTRVGMSGYLRRSTK